LRAPTPCCFAPVVARDTDRRYTADASCGRLWTYSGDKTEIAAFTGSLAGEIVANAPLSIAVMKKQLRILADAQGISPELFERVQGLRRNRLR
jgi:hypothetical protein